MSFFEKLFGSFSDKELKRINPIKDMADRVVFMYQGKIHEEGPAKEIFAHPKTPELTQFISRVRSGL